MGKAGLSIGDSMVKLTNSGMVIGQRDRNDFVEEFTDGLGIALNGTVGDAEEE